MIIATTMYPWLDLVRRFLTMVHPLSWTAYQPISLIWDYLFWGDKAQFQLKAKMHPSDIIPALDFEKSLPPHYLLRAWNRFLQSLRRKNVSTIDRDRLVRAILPIFHHPHIKAPMRILLCEEVEKLAGLHNHFDRVQAHRSLLTEFTVRNYCGNSFHPEYIQAAVGHPSVYATGLPNLLKQQPSMHGPESFTQNKLELNIKPCVNKYKPWHENNVSVISPPSKLVLTQCRNFQFMHSKVP